MARFPIANPELRSTGSVNGMLPTHADALGRTQVVGTSSVQAPALKQFVSVTDQPWGAKGNSKRVTDGAITTGTALLSSATANFTSADVGKRIDIVGAGVAGVGVSGVITTVVSAGSVNAIATNVLASLLSTGSPITTLTVTALTTSIANGTVITLTDPTGAHSQSWTLTSPASAGATSLAVASQTPNFAYPSLSTFTSALNASTTVSGATVTYGTDDTAAFQNAQNAVSATGGGRLLVPAGSNYLIGTIHMASNVVIEARGATFHMQTTSNNAGFRSLVSQGDPAVVNWSIIGARFVGDNAAYVTGTQVCVFVNTSGSTDIRVQDCTFTNIPDCAIDFASVARCWILNNRFDTITTGAGRNAINIELSNAAVSSDVTIDGNTLTNIATQAIHMGSNGANSMTISSLRASITNNKIFGASGVAITMEIADAGGGVGFGVANGAIANNVIDTNGGAGIAMGVGAPNQSPNQRWTIANNTVNSPGVASAGISGISACGSDITVVGNSVSMGGQTTTHGILVNGTSQTVTATLDGTTNVLTSVTVLNPATQTQIPNGTVLSGTGIPAGAYLVSGAGTATWTISLPTTVATTTTVTGSVAGQNIVVADNVVHMPNTTSGDALHITNLSYSTIANNNLFFDAGSASGSTYCLLMSSCYYCSIVNNRLTNSPRWGMSLNKCHDMDITLNKVHNPNQNGSAADGIDMTTCTNMFVDYNQIWDDTGASKINIAINSVTSGSGHRARGNRIAGATNGTPIVTVAHFVEIRDNILPSTGHLGATVAETYPGTGVTFVNPHPWPVKMCIAGGTITQIFISTANCSNLITTGLTSGTFDLDVGGGIRCTSSVNPTTFNSGPA